MLLCLLCLTTYAATAQTSIPAPTAVFEHQPSTIALPEHKLSKAMLLARGDQAVLELADGFTFSGEVISNEQVYSNLQTLIVRTTEFNNAVMQISRQTQQDGSILFAAHIFANRSTDGFQLKRANDGIYLLQKFETALVLQDCNMQ